MWWKHGDDQFLVFQAGVGGTFQDKNKTGALPGQIEVKIFNGIEQGDGIFQVYRPPAPFLRIFTTLKIVFEAILAGKILEGVCCL